MSANIFVVVISRMEGHERTVRVASSSPISWFHYFPKLAEEEQGVFFVSDLVTQACLCIDFNITGSDAPTDALIVCCTSCFLPSPFSPLRPNHQFHSSPAGTRMVSISLNCTCTNLNQGGAPRWFNTEKEMSQPADQLYRWQQLHAITGVQG